MIPNTNIILSSTAQVGNQPSKNYMMHLTSEIINGFCDKQEAMKQVIFKILNTERYDYIIYSWNYGIELKDLYGEPLTYVCPETKRRIEEALIQDDRINSVDNFEFTFPKKGEILVTFTAHTVFGDVKSEKAVSF